MQHLMQTATPNTLCGAKTRNGGTCKTAAMPNGRCRMHGGASLSGIASGTFKNGRRSKYLPARLMDNYHAALDDPELLSVRDEIALLDTRLSELLSRVDTGEAGLMWKSARKAHDDLRKALAKGKAGTVDAQIALRDLDNILGQGVTDYAVWSEIQAVVQQRRSLAESEQKRLVAMQQMMTAEQALLWASALLEAVRRNVTDRQQLNAIQTEFSLLMNKPAEVSRD